jgi:hypothetical protein
VHCSGTSLQTGVHFIRGSKRLQAGEIFKRDYDKGGYELFFNECNNALWDTFALLSTVMIVDLAFVDQLNRETTAHPQLFRTARELRLAGVTSWFVVTSILDSVPDDLETLPLNNLNQFGELRGLNQRLPRRDKARLRPIQPTIDAPGPMNGHLSQYRHKFRKLKFLEIRTAGQCFEAREFWLGAGRPYWDEAIEDQQYQEIGEFIRAVSPTLIDLLFSQGPVNSQCTDLNGVSHNGLDLQPLKHRFHVQVLPAILESSWPSLRAMTLHGVGAWPTETHKSTRFLEGRSRHTARMKRRVRRACGAHV